MKNEVINDLLGYEGLKIIQCPDAFHFSLDSTLLADFVSITSIVKQIIDLGSGNGPIPLFLSLKTDAKIYGVEIQKDIYDLAVRSVKINNLDHQITILNDDIKNMHNVLGVSQFDVVTCNPPYFPYKEDSRVNKNDYLTIARHEVLVTLNDVIIEAKRLLKDGGTFAMVHKADRFLDVVESFRQNGIEPKRMRFVYPKKNSNDALLVLIEGKKSLKRGNLKVLKPLYVHNLKGDYTKEILSIFRYKEERFEK